MNYPPYAIESVASFSRSRIVGVQPIDRHLDPLAHWSELEIRTKLLQLRVASSLLELPIRFRLVEHNLEELMQRGGVRERSQRERKGKSARSTRSGGRPVASATM